MDMLMDAQSFDSNGVPSKWDIRLSNGLSTALEGKNELRQRAAVAAFLMLGTVPGLTTVGIDWPGYLTGGVNPREIDAQVRDAMYNYTQDTTFVPYYFIKNGRLQLSIQEAKHGD